MKFQAVIFDLDGTLLNTLDDIAHAMNTALDAVGAPRHLLGDYRSFVGQGLEKLAYLALPPGMRDEKLIARSVEVLRREYSRCWDHATRPYDGVIPMLAALKRRSVSMAVFSNKAHEFTLKIVSRFFGIDLFTAVLGAGNFQHKPDPAGAIHCANMLGAIPCDVLFIGDSDIDMKTAVNADMFPLGVLWGFRTAEELLANGAKRLVKTPGEIIGIVEGLESGDTQP